MPFLKFLFLICCSFSILSSVESNCIDILQYDHPDFGCQNCTGCMKGKGLDLTEYIPSTKLGKKRCYSCKPCPLGTFQNASVVIESCKQCDKCENKKILKNCSATEDAICKDCLDGYHKVSNKAGSIICEKSKSAETTNVKIYLGLFISTFILLVLVLFCVIVLCIYIKKEEEELRNVLTIFPCWNKDKDKQEKPKAKETDNTQEVSRFIPTDKQEKPKAKETDNTQEVSRFIPTDEQEKPNVKADNTLLTDAKGIGKTPEEIMKTMEATDNITIAREIGSDWKFLAHCLGFSKVDIEEIENSERQLKDRAISMIKRYEEKHIPKNRDSLTLALIKTGRLDLLIQKRSGIFSVPENC